LKDYLTLDDVRLDNKMVLVRVDFNSPMDPSGNILDDKRIRSYLDTCASLRTAGWSSWPIRAGREWVTIPH